MTRSIQAFSLIEIIVLLLIISVLLAAAQAKPQKHSFLLRQTTTDVANMLLQARAHAQYFATKVIVSHEGSQIISSASEQKLAHVVLPAPITVSTAKSTISFSAEGSNQPARFSLSDGSTNCSVTISLFGRIRKECN